MDEENTDEKGEQLKEKGKEEDDTSMSMPSGGEIFKNTSGLMGNIKGWWFKHPSGCGKL